MTRRTPRRALLGLLAALMLAAGSASAHHTDGNPGTGGLNPAQYIGLSYPYYSYNSSIVFDATQNDHSVKIKSTRMDIPAGWHIAINSIDASTHADCSTLTSANITAGAERVGGATINIHNDDSRGKAAYVPYNGFLYFLNYDTGTRTATLCGRITTSSSLIPTANREIMFRVLLTSNVDGSGFMTYDFNAVPGAVAGTRSIDDNAYYNGKNTSILYTRIELNTLTGGNYNTDPTGKKTAVRFVWNPDTTGNYTFKGTYTPCDTGACASSVPPATRFTTIAITNYPVGFHPGAQFSAPALWTVARGPDPIAIKWRPPATTSPSDKIKGYVVSISADYVPNSTKTLYFVTDKDNPSVANPNPCGTDGAAAECATTLQLPYTSDAAVPIGADNNYSMTLVTIFQDGHRSDGRCDDGSGAGLPAPCSPGDTVPAFTLSGISRTQFMYRATAWPMVYRQIVNASQGIYGVWQVYVLFADLDGHQIEFVRWKPTGERFFGGGLGVSGSNSAGGAIAFHNFSGPQHYHIDATLTSTSASGLWILTSSTNDIQDMYRFNMSRI